MFLITRAKESKRRHALRQAIESLENRLLLAYSLDPSFDGDGRLIGPAGSAVDLELQHDGKMVVGVDNPWPAVDYLLRYNPDGSLDTSFGGGDGRVDLPDNNHSIAAIALSGDKIVAAINTNPDAEQFVYRFNSDGSYDTSFGGGDGIAGLGLFTLMAVDNVAVQSDGKIVVSGSNYSWFQSSHDPSSRFPEWDSLAVARLNTDGTADTSFSSGSGMRWVSSDAADNYPVGLGIQPGTGTIVVGGSDSTSHIIAGFAPTNGQVLFYTRIPYDQLSGGISALDFQPDGSIIVGNSGGTNGGALFRLTPTGERDLSFANDSHFTDRSVADVQVLADGKILVSGSLYEGGVAKGMVGRFTPSGTFDNTFAPGGYQTVTWGTTNNALDVEFTPDGKVITAGVGWTGEQPQVGLARFADPAVVQGPFRGRPFNLNELIQAEDFDNGGENVAYHDNDTNNRGGAYRPGEGVDIEATTDSGGGYNVGWTLPGEWLEYAINVPTPGPYNIETRLAALKGGQVHFTIDGEPVASLTAGVTGGFQNWTTVSRSLGMLAAGNHVLGVHIDSVGGPDSAINFNWFRVVPGSTTGTGNGLLGQYFNEMDFTGQSFFRTDATINYNWSTGSPMEAIAPDTFSVRWTGTIEAPATGRYTFYTTTDDGVRLTINGQRIIDHFTPQAATEWSGSIDLLGGQKYSIQMDYFERYNGALARLEWSGPGIARQVVPTSQLYSDPGTPDTQPPGPIGASGVTDVSDNSAILRWSGATDNVGVAGYEVWLNNGSVTIHGVNDHDHLFTNLQPDTDYSAHIRAFDAAANRGPTTSIGFRTEPAPTTSGLRGDYFNNSDFTAPVLTRTDQNISFNWGTGSPAPGIDPDTFSVRWTGKITAPTTGRYTFYTTTDDGVRLWVNNQLLIDKFVPQAATEWSGGIDLVAGQSYDIRMDYFDRSGGAQARLSWSGPSIAKQVVPASAFSGGGSTTDTQPPSATPNLGATRIGSDSMDLGWDAATDNVAVTGYELRINDGNPILVSANARTYTANNLQPNTSYKFTISAFDAAGNRGPLSTLVATTTATPAGGGLGGIYFNNMDFTSPVFTRTDSTINFNWGTGSPDPRIDADSFSVRWTGKITAPTTGRYTFYTSSDDGARLTINGQRIIDKLVPQSTTTWSGSIDLVAGQQYSIVLEYFDRAGGANARLEWSGPGIARQVVPESALSVG